MILTLIGYRATGKTTLAKLVAERLGWDWIDADVEIERRAGKSIASIFAEQGEPAFRDLEAQVIADLCRRDRLGFGPKLLPGFTVGVAVELPPHRGACEQIGKLFVSKSLVLAAGGGAPLRPQNRRAMREAGEVVWLTAKPETILTRMTGDATTTTRRPDLTDKGPLAEIVHLLQVRTPIYRETAHRVLDTEGKTPDELVDAVIASCRLRHEKLKTEN